MNHTTLDKFGRVLLPKQVRENLGLHPGDVLDILVREGTAVVSKAPKKGAGVAFRNGVPYFTGYEWAGDIPMKEYIKRMEEEEVLRKLGPWPK